MSVGRTGRSCGVPYGTWPSAGIRQFLDVGTGLPSANNTHEVAQAIAPESRVVYVDNDPIVLAHARALLTSGPHGATGFLDADARDTATILAEAAKLLDFSKPVAVMLIAHLARDRRRRLLPARRRPDGRGPARQLPGDLARRQRPAAAVARRQRRRRPAQHADVPARHPAQPEQMPSSSTVWSCSNQAWSRSRSGDRTVPRKAPAPPCAEASAASPRRAESAARPRSRYRHGPRRARTRTGAAARLAAGRPPRLGRIVRATCASCGYGRLQDWFEVPPQAQIWDWVPEPP